MLEVAAAAGAGAAVAVAVLAVALPAPRLDSDSPPVRWLRPRIELWWAGEARLAAGAGLTLDARSLACAQLAVGISGSAIAVGLTGLPVLAAPGAVGGIAAVRFVAGARARARRIALQDAILESVRLLRQVLESGDTSVHQAVAILADRGPAPLRHEFRLIAAATIGRRQAWSAARDRIAEPIFDLLAAAVLIQGPGGGELATLFTHLETALAGALEVEREAEALQVQARSAAAIIVSLPIAFLIGLSALRSPYLAAFHEPAGEAFLLLMLALMSASYLWMRRLLRLPRLRRVRLMDA
jgi:Flp pilus assembly protein TadB